MIQQVRRVIREVTPPVLLSWTAGSKVHSNLGLDHPETLKYLSRENLLDARSVVQREIEQAKLRAGSEGLYLDVGGRNGEYSHLAEGFEYHILDLAPGDVAGAKVVAGDISSCPEIASDSYDVVFSINLFEHVKRPWEAASEIGRILKPGGVSITDTLFAWEYHDKPSDYWRFTHNALDSIFTEYGGLTTALTGYDISQRWRNLNNGSFAEHWRVVHIGRKPQ